MVLLGLFRATASSSRSAAWLGSTTVLSRASSPPSWTSSTTSASSSTERISNVRSSPSAGFSSPDRWSRSDVEPAPANSELPLPRRASLRNSLRAPLERPSPDSRGDRPSPISRDTRSSSSGENWPSSPEPDPARNDPPSPI